MTSLRPLGACPKMGKKDKERSLQNEVKGEKREKSLWKWVSLYSRLKGCPDNSQGFTHCITCGKVHHYKDMDAGHYISRKWKPTKYDDDNIHAQCVHCNQHLAGNVDKYAEVLGVEIAEALFKKSRTPAKKMRLWEIESMIGEYRQKAKDEAYRVGVEIR